MRYKIKKRFSDEVLVEDEAESFKEFVEKNKGNLRGSNLSDSKIKITQ